MVTPAFLVIPLVYFVGARADRPRLRSAIRASTAASSGLLMAATLPLASGALTRWLIGNDRGGQLRLIFIHQD